MHERRFNREIERLRDPERLIRMEIPRVVSLALENLKEPHTILDAGMGSGVFAEQFAALGLQVTGIDANPNMVSAAREFVPTAIFHEGAAEKLPFDDGAFDLVFMGLLLHETDAPLEALREARRVAVQRLAVLEWPDEDQPFGPPRSDRLSFEMIRSLALQAGFTQVEVIRLENLALYRIS